MVTAILWMIAGIITLGEFLFAFLFLFNKKYITSVLYFALGFYWLWIIFAKLC